LKLSFKTGGRDTFLSKFNMVLNSKAWDQKASTSAPQKKEFSTTKAGVTGIIRNTDAKAKETDQALQQAFSDLTALMDKAKDLVVIAEKLSQQQAKEKTPDSQEEDSELKSMLVSIGISSPVTKY
jgi:ESCRT-II complex subunit VPS36